MPLPNLIIVGAMKSATSTLRDVLREHPEVWMFEKEIRYFSGPRYTEDLQGYRHHFANAEGFKVIGEKSPTYSVVPGTAERIARALPDARIVFQMREPGARSYSNYWHRVAKGKEKRTFDDVVQRELAGEVDPTHYTQHVLARSLYIHQVDEYLDHFPADQVHLMLFEHYQSNPSDEIARLCRFLDIDDSVELSVTTQSNVTHMTRSPWLMRLANYALKRSQKNVLEQRLAKKTAGYPPMGDEMRARLYDHFAPFNELLAQRTGLDLSAWQPLHDSIAPAAEAAAVR